jgi:hypothetical protein
MTVEIENEGMKNEEVMGNEEVMDTGNEEMKGGKRRRRKSTKKKHHKKRGKSSKRKSHKKSRKSGKMNYLVFCKQYAKKHGLKNAGAAMKNPDCKRAFHAQK